MPEPLNQEQNRSNDQIPIEPSEQDSADDQIKALLRAAYSGSWEPRVRLYGGLGVNPGERTRLGQFLLRLLATTRLLSVSPWELPRSLVVSLRCCRN